MNKASHTIRLVALAYMRTGNNLFYYSHLQGADEAISRASDSVPPTKFMKTNQGSGVKLLRCLGT